MVHPSRDWTAGESLRAGTALARRDHGGSLTYRGSEELRSHFGSHGILAGVAMDPVQGSGRVAVSERGVRQLSVPVSLIVKNFSRGSDVSVVNHDTLNFVLTYAVFCLL